MTDNDQIRILLVEDDPMVQEVNRLFIEKTDGFTVVGAAPNGEKARQLVDELKPDLVLLDIYMAVEDGLTTIKNLRDSQQNVDIIAVTAANDTNTIKTLLRYGVIDYIVKPFTYERLSKALNKYRDMYNQLNKPGEFSQAKLDVLFKQKEDKKVKQLDKLPKGLQLPTLNQIMSYLKTIDRAQSAEEIGANVGLARVTVGRYLNYLESCQKVKVTLTYGGIGRPIQLYELVENHVSEE